jgi:CheY-like chemotaxis protein
MARSVLKILVAEASITGAEHLVRTLIRSGFAPEPFIATGRSEYLASVAPSFEAILCTDSVPDLDPVSALRLLKQKSLDIPLIVVGNRMGDEQAVECMREGAADVLFRDRLSRLGATIMNGELKSSPRSSSPRATPSSRFRKTES